MVIPDDADTIASKYKRVLSQPYGFLKKPNFETPCLLIRLNELEQAGATHDQMVSLLEGLRRNKDLHLLNRCEAARRVAVYIRAFRHASLKNIATARNALRWAARNSPDAMMRMRVLNTHAQLLYILRARGGKHNPAYYAERAIRLLRDRLALARRRRSPDAAVGLKLHSTSVGTSFNILNGLRSRNKRYELLLRSLERELAALPYEGGSPRGADDSDGGSTEGGRR